MSCKYCGSSNHEPDKCRMMNLSKALTGQKYKADNLPRNLIITDEENLFKVIEGIHFLKTLKVIRNK